MTVLVLLDVLLGTLEASTRCNPQAALARLKGPESFHKRKFLKIAQKAVESTGTSKMAHRSLIEGGVLLDLALDLQKQLQWANQPDYRSEEFILVFVDTAKTINMTEYMEMVFAYKSLCSLGPG